MRLTQHFALVAVAAMASFGCASQLASDPEAPVIEMGDVDRFFAVYDAAGGRPSVARLQSDYVDAGSDGLHTLMALRDVTAEKIARRISDTPDLYEKAKVCAQDLPQIRRRLAQALAQLRSLYPKARNAPVTIVVGRGKPVGVGSPETGVQVGLEALCAADFLNANVEDRFVYVIAHEYVHVQQAPDLSERVEDTGGTVLEVSLIEGVAEFVGELIAGDVAYGSLRANVKGRETEIEKAFIRDKDKTDLSDWVYNSAPNEPGDLGYWVGYRIAKAFYWNAPDKRAAIADMLEFTDAETFLKASGWRPGIDLE